MAPQTTSCGRPASKPTADRRTAHRAGSMARRSGRSRMRRSSLPSIGNVAPATHALRRTGTVDAGVHGRTRHSRLAVEPRSQPFARRLPGHRRAVAPGSVVAIASGRVGPGARIHVSQSAVVEQVAGRRGSIVLARAVAEFPAFGLVDVRADGVDGAIALRGGARRDLRFDENGAPLVRGIYGLGATATFEVEAMTSFEALPRRLQWYDRPRDEYFNARAARLPVWQRFLQAVRRSARARSARGGGASGPRDRAGVQL